MSDFKCSFCGGVIARRIDTKSFFYGTGRLTVLSMVVTTFNCKECGEYSDEPEAKQQAIDEYLESLKY